MDSRRIRYEAIICCKKSERQMIAAGKDIVRGLSESFGGATMTPCTGGWSENGNDTLNTYKDVCLENGIRVILTVLVQDTDRGYEMLTEQIARIVREHSLEAQFIHVDRFTIDALHFQINSREFFSALS